MGSTDRWAIVLAAGAGSRLATVTTSDTGHVVPKQFCSLRGGRSLLADTLSRARAFVPHERVVVVVAAQHRRFWEGDLAGLPPENVIVQPLDRGTAAGVLLPLMAILERDPAARVAVLPSDHHVRKEGVLAATMEAALEALGAHASSVILLGMRPRCAETGYGWILPEPSRVPLRRVAAFVEKPEPAVARLLLDEGALWNSFLLAARAATLAAMYARHLPALHASFSTAFAVPGRARARALEASYARCASHDFSRSLLQAAPGALRVLDTPECGWTDLGTPGRLRDCLRSLPPQPAAARPPRWLDLARAAAGAGTPDEKANTDIHGRISMKVGQLMQREVAKVSPEDGLDRAATVMRERDCGFLPVVVRGQRVAGVLTDRDICMAAARTERALSKLKVGDHMTRLVHTCEPTDDVREAERAMALHQVRRLPVVDREGNLVGVLSLDDVAREAFREQGLLAPPVSNAGVGQTLGQITRPHLALNNEDARGSRR
jgi:mannose-1-phosphate guanylyltransferase